MKIRNGFVSNSSSSSFIMPVNKDKKMVIEIGIEDFQRIMGDSDDSSVSEILSNEDDVKNAMTKEYGYKSFEEMMVDEDWLMKRFEKMMVHIKEGKGVVFGSIGYGETLASSIIEKCGGKVDD